MLSLEVDCEPSALAYDISKICSNLNQQCSGLVFNKE